MRLNSAPNGECFIYFIGPVDQRIGHVKIGMTSKSVQKRMAALQTGSPYRLTVYGFVASKAKYEEALHRLFEPLRLSGEWFKAEGALATVLADMQDTYGHGSEWSDYCLWQSIFAALKAPENIGSAIPQALSYLDKRVALIFPPICTSDCEVLG